MVALIGRGVCAVYSDNELFSEAECLGTASLGSINDTSQSVALHSIPLSVSKVFYILYLKEEYCVHALEMKSHIK